MGGLFDGIGEIAVFMIRLGIFFIMHSLVYLLYAGQACGFFELRPATSWPDGAWLFCCC